MVYVVQWATVLNSRTALAYSLHSLLVPADAPSTSIFVSPSTTGFGTSGSCSSKIATFGITYANISGRCGEMGNRLCPSKRRSPSKMLISVLPNRSRLLWKGWFKCGFK
uniref:Putative secreted protein n=1 Tax=Anopheles triannulatus TaxID=58253 RepID=A0A2M4B4U2_9DIPT